MIRFVSSYPEDRGKKWLAWFSYLELVWIETDYAARDDPSDVSSMAVVITKFDQLVDKRNSPF